MAQLREHKRRDRIGGRVRLLGGPGVAAGGVTPTVTTLAGTWTRTRGSGYGGKVSIDLHDLLLRRRGEGY
ncbi:MAG: hypothetical protein Q4P32_03260 [Micrococcales bacterium]|nr:hypothetical protein [Micrococcales bacterium]